MDRVELEKRTKRFALRIIEFVATLPKGRVGDVIGYQLVKAGTSVGANYREANRGESRNDFIHKIGIALARGGRVVGDLYECRTNCESRKSVTQVLAIPQSDTGAAGFRNSNFAIRNSQF